MSKSEGRAVALEGLLLPGLPPVIFSARATAARGRAYLRHLFMANEILAAVLNTLHNLHFYLDIMRRIRAAIAADRLGELQAGLHAAAATGLE